MLIIPLNLDSVLLLLHNSKLAYCLFNLTSDTELSEISVRLQLVSVPFSSLLLAIDLVQ